jgi:hypothetical protein
MNPNGLDICDPLLPYAPSSRATNATTSSNAIKFPLISGGTLRKEQLILGVLEAAKLIRSTEFVIIGSQAVHGTLPDAPIDAVSKSIDVDLFPTNYRESMFVPMHAELGFESEFFDKHGLIDLPTLEQRLQAIPRTTPKRIQETINEVRLYPQIIAEADTVKTRLEKRRNK